MEAKAARIPIVISEQRTRVHGRDYVEYSDWGREADANHLTACRGTQDVVANQGLDSEVLRCRTSAENNNKSRART